jgi:hypothetical protein
MNMETLEKLQLACQTLLFSTQAHFMGFSTLRIEDVDSLGAVLNDKERSLLGLYDRFSRVSLEKAVLEAAAEEKKEGTRTCY